MDFEHTVPFNVSDVLHAKEQYGQLLQMAEIKAAFLKSLHIKEPMDKLNNDIIRATLTEIIHVHKMIGAIERVLDKYLENSNNKGRS